VKIGNPLDLIRTGPLAGSGASAPADKSKADAGTAKATANSASVKVTNGLAALTAAGDDSDSFDVKRVAEMKAAIADGSFKVDAEKVADKVIASNLEALTRTKG
jgi:negative regulator of flagellin synthesis FlgM